tara:strand:+ start:120 stop:728 length:609 start_codon:yes stop_codon:yes gene_type:complete
MKKPLYIFGDSYVDLGFDRGAIGERMWVRQLSKTFDTRNFGLRGTGPDWNLHQLIEHLPNHKPHLLYIGTEINRLNLRNTQPTQQAMLKNQYGSGRMAIIFDELISMPEWQLTESVKCLSAVASLAHHFDRVLYFGSDTISQSVLNIVNIPHNMHVSNYAMTPLSISEPEYASVSGPDHRSNHYTEYNHDMLTQYSEEYFNA